MLGMHMADQVDGKMEGWMGIQNYCRMKERGRELEATIHLFITTKTTEKGTLKLLCTIIMPCMHVASRPSSLIVH